MIKFPFTTLQQCNLDWIMQQLHKILDFMPLNGSPGDVLQRNVDGAAWMPIAAVSMDIHGLDSIADVSPADELPIYDNSLQGNFKVSVSDLLDSLTIPVESVNGMTGDVILDAADVGALPDTTVIPDSTSDLVNDAGFVDAAGAAAAAPVQKVNNLTGQVWIDKFGVGLGNVDNVQQYSANNPPPYPVTSVNGQTGDVVITPGGGGMEATLLWTNPAPTSTFAAQTVSLDLSDCQFVLIEYSQDYGFVTSTVMLPVPTITPSPGYAAYNSYMNLNWAGSQFTIFERRCVITVAGIVFEDATEFSAYNTAQTATTNNNLGVPKRIWGIK